MADDQVVDGEGQGGTPGETVVLTRSDYDDMIGKLTGLQIKVEQSEAKVREEGERRTAEENARLQRERETRARNPQIDFDRMTKAEFAQFILHQVNQGMIQPVLELVMTNSVKEEIKETASKHEDFWDYKDEVYKLTTENPQLTIEKAYKLAKAEFPDKAKKKEEEAKPKYVPVGEKPGPTRGKVITDVGGKTVRAAAMKAFDEISKDLPDD